MLLKNQQITRDSLGLKLFLDSNEFFHSSIQSIFTARDPFHNSVCWINHIHLPKIPTSPRFQKVSPEINSQLQFYGNKKKH